MTRRRDDAGAVTAELAEALPVLLALTVVLVWLVGLGAAQVRVVDASREAARVVARGDDESQAVALALRIAPPGATVRVTYEAGDVVVDTEAHVAPPGTLGRFGTVTVRARGQVGADARLRRVDSDLTFKLGEYRRGSQVEFTVRTTLTAGREGAATITGTPTASARVRKVGSSAACQTRRISGQSTIRTVACDPAHLPARNKKYDFKRPDDRADFVPRRPSAGSSVL